MISKSHLYGAAQFGWTVLVIGGIVAVETGQLEPAVSSTVLPDQDAVLFGVAAVVAGVGWIAIGRLRVRSWRKMGRRAGLSTDGWSLDVFGPRTMPALSGTVNGRPVRVTDDAERHHVDGNVNTKHWTVVAAELDEAPGGGGVLKRRDDGGIVSTWGDSDVAEAGLSQRSRAAIENVERVDALTVGDADESDDPATVSNRLEGILLDADELEANLEAVVAVADAVETADTASTQASASADTTA